MYHKTVYLVLKAAADATDTLAIHAQGKLSLCTTAMHKMSTMPWDTRQTNHSVHLQVTRPAVLHAQKGEKGAQTPEDVSRLVFVFGKSPLKTFKGFTCTSALHALWCLTLSILTENFHVYLHNKNTKA